MAKSKTKKAKVNKSSDKKKGPPKKVKSPIKAPARGEVSAFEPFQTLRKQVDDLFTNFTVSWPHFEMPKIEWPTLTGTDTEDAIAKFDLSENGKSVKVVADIPGVDEKNVEVLVLDGVLTSREKRTLNMKRKVRISTFQNAASAHSAAHFGCRMVSMRRL